MRTISDALRGVNAYPVPPRTLDTLTLRRGLDPDGDATCDVLRSAPFRLCEADLLTWLSLAPDVSQGGQTYSLTDDQREDMRRRAKRLYEEFGEDGDKPKTSYGYKGSQL